MNETPINVVSHKFKCQRGMLQGLQQMASTFAGIVTAFCNSLQWSTLSLIVSQFKDRLYFGIHRDLIDLMRLPDLTHKRARALHDAGITSLVELAGTDVLALEQLLYNSLSFDSAKQHENENEMEAEKRNSARNFFITGKAGITVAEAAKLLISEARQFVQYEIGVGSIKWTQEKNDSKIPVVELHMSLEQEREEELQQPAKQIKRKTPDRDMSPEQLSPYKIRKLNPGDRLRTQQESKQSTQSRYNLKDKEKNITKGNAINELNLPVLDNLINNNPAPSKSTQRKEESVAKVKNPTNSSQKLGTNGPKLELRKSISTHFDQPKTQVLKESDNLIASKPRQHTNKGDSLQQQNDNTQKKENPTIKEIVGEKENEIQEIPRHQDNEKKDGKVKLLSAEFAQTPPEKPLAQVNQPTVNTKRQESSSGRHENRLPDQVSGTESKKPATTDKDELPSTSAACRKELLKKEMEERRRIALMKINKRRAEMENRAPDAMSGKTPLPINRDTNPLTSGEVTTQKPSSMINTPIENPVQETRTTTPTPEQDLFTGEDSFLLSTGLDAALTAAERKPLADADEIPSSQPKEVEVATPRLMRSYQHRSQRRNSFRPTSPSQLEADADNPQRPQRVESVKPTSTPPPPPAQEPDTASSIELSNLSIENSLIKHPTQLNASHILSCSKTDENASSFSSMDIVDICGDRSLCHLAMEELQQATRCGFSVGLQHQAGKRKPLIGANLLINQVAAAEEREAAAGKETLFQLDDSCFIAGIAFSVADNVVYYLNLQQEEHHKVNTAKKVQNLYSLLERSDLTLLIHDGKEQLKALRRALPDLKKVNVKVEDPKVANWLLQPDQTLSFQNMVSSACPLIVEMTNSEIFLQSANNSHQSA